MKIDCDREILSVLGNLRWESGGTSDGTGMSGSGRSWAKKMAVVANELPKRSLKRPSNSWVTGSRNNADAAPFQTSAFQTATVAGQFQSEILSLCLELGERKTKQKRRRKHATKSDLSWHIFPFFPQVVGLIFVSLHVKPT